MDREIISITVDGFGKIERYRYLEKGRVDNGVIEVFTKNVIFAPVQWYRHCRFEYNGKYVIAVEYDKKL